VLIAPGTRLGQYEVQESIGQGAMGVVYRAYHSQLERTGAVKVMQGLTPDAQTVTQFRHEAQAIAKLRHPNIVEVYDFGDYQSTPYMVVEYVPGGSLAARMAQGPLEPATALKYLRGIAAGLDYAHGHGVVHRDVKPANVLLTSDDSPVLADFGLAKLMQGSSLKSMTGVTTGTPAYMAPEQVAGAHAGPAADRYSLATMAYEMLTGVIPFDGEGLMELLYAQVHRYPKAPSERVAALGPGVDAVIMRGLAKDPGQRWETCTAFVEALESALAPGPAVEVAEAMALAPPVARTKPLARPLTRSARRVDRRVVAAAALLLVLISFGVCAVVAQATTLTVNPSQAARGQTVHVTAGHVPAHQVGEIQLHSVVHTYPFRANDQGQVDVDMDVPLDAELGDHVVKICWDNACHGDAPLKVVGGAAQVSPSPVGSPSATPSGAPSGSPTPTASPTASRTSPTPGSTPRPTSTPTTSSTPKASPSPSPTPTMPAPAISVTPTTVHILTSRDITVSGTNWTAGGKVIITFIQLGVVTTQIGNQNVQSNGSFSWTGGIPSAALPGSATIQVCSGTVCKSAAITVST
jgi:serine/threonine protein kinase